MQRNRCSEMVVISGFEARITTISAQWYAAPIRRYRAGRGRSGDFVTRRPPVARRSELLGSCSSLPRLLVEQHAEQECEWVVGEQTISGVVTGDEERRGGHEPTLERGRRAVAGPSNDAVAKARVTLLPQ
jgi:hypothetical protein